MRTPPIAAAILVIGLSENAHTQSLEALSLDIAGGNIIAAGKWLKTADGSVDIHFGVTFKSPPVVIVSPNWTAQVGCIDTITRIDNDKFQVTSCNTGPEYSVNWMAVGRR